MLVSNCCGARFYYPDYPDNDICTSCKEHAIPMEEEDSREEVSALYERMFKEDEK